MPHVTIEYSANVADVTDIDGLVGALHDAALATGVAPLDALRTRAVAREHYAVGDRHPDNMFVAVTARLAVGRTAEQRQTLLDALLAALDARLGPAQDTMMLSVECQEIEPVMRINKNNLRPAIAARAGD